MSHDPEPLTARLRLDRKLLPRRLLVVSNRLPYQIRIAGDEVTLERGLGGLVTAMDPVMRSTGGLWFGWTGSHHPVPSSIQVAERMGGGVSYELRPLELSQTEVSRYYLGYANKAIWPLFHYFQEHCEFNDEDWESYCSVNRKFASKVVSEYRDGDYVWIHDYHLMLVPAMIRRDLPDADIGFFLHIPFPPPELFQIAHNADDIIEGLLGADLIGFHTPSNARNFVRTVATMTELPYSVSGGWLRKDGRRVKVGDFPISIDCDHFERMASRPGIDDEVRAIRDNYRAEVLAIGVDRLDYTKGILKRLNAIEIMLARHPDIQGKFTFIQLSAPSRTKVSAYRSLRGKIEQMVGHINGRFGGKGCLPVDYRYEGHAQEELVAYYRAADAALVTPLRDGMNLVAKEYVISQIDGNGCLVLSQFAGASRELTHAIQVNPYHAESLAEGIYRAITMSVTERRSRMARMRQIVRNNDINWWVEHFLRAQRDAVRHRDNQPQ
ncbi:MAG: trehalose-6-phosphate synthase [Acidobacteriota bacterium]|nr:MAG: trehalose-6-phosphate synthase [Acidobacteriota bacterium]